MVLTVTLNPAIDKVLEVPGFRVGAHARSRVLSLLPAGKGVNVARGVVRLGGRATACGFIGRAEEELFVSSLAADGVDAHFDVVDGLTRTNTTVLDPQSRSTTHLREEGFEVSARDRAALTDRLLRWIAHHPGGIVLFAGSLPNGMEPEHFAEMLKTCADAGADLVADTSGSALCAAYASGVVGTLKPNLDEIGELVGREVPRLEAVEVARELCDRVQTILLTLGSDGAWLVRADSAVGYRCVLTEGEVHNTVGCGDAFLAGWLSAAPRETAFADRLAWAVTTGAASAMSASTVGYDLSVVRRLLRRCEKV